MKYEKNAHTPTRHTPPPWCRPWPMFVFQMAVLWSHRLSWATLGFVCILLWTASSLMHPEPSPADLMHTSWTNFLLYFVATAMIFIVGTRKKYAFFVGMKCTRAFHRAQIAAHLVSCLPVILLHACATALHSLSQATWNALAMALFALVGAQAIFGNLQPHLKGLDEPRQYALTLVVSGPWVLTAWLMGLLGADFTAPNAHLFLCGLGVLGLLQYSAGLWTNTP